MWQKHFILLEKIFATLFFFIPIVPFIITKNSEMIIAYVTFLAILAALFREKILSYYFPPLLEIRLAEAPHHFAIVPGVHPVTGNPAGDVAVIGILVENIGFTPAKNVMVLFNGIESNMVINMNRYCSLPLIRSWSRPQETRVNFIPPKTPIRFSICYTTSSAPQIFDFEFLQKPNALSSINCPINQKTTFKFETKAIADNSKAVSSMIEIEFMGNYIHGLNIKMLDC